MIIDLYVYDPIETQHHEISFYEKVYMCGSDERVAVTCVHGGKLTGRHKGGSVRQ